MRLINQTNFPLMLEDGTQLAAAGTDGSTREIEAISDSDRARLSGRVMIVGGEEPPASQPGPSDTPATTSAGEVSPAEYAVSDHEAGATSSMSEKDARDSTGRTPRGGR